MQLSLHDFKCDIFQYFTEIAVASPISESLYGSITAGILEIIVRGNSQPDYSAPLLQILHENISNLQHVNEVQESIGVLQSLINVLTDKGYSRVDKTQWLWMYLLPGDSCIFHYLLNSIKAIIHANSAPLQSPGNPNEILNLAIRKLQVSICQITCDNKKNDFICSHERAFPLIVLKELEENKYGLLRSRELIEFDQDESSNLNLLSVNYFINTSETADPPHDQVQRTSSRFSLNTEQVKQPIKRKEGDFQIYPGTDASITKHINEHKENQSRVQENKLLHSSHRSLDSSIGYIEVSELCLEFIKNSKIFNPKLIFDLKSLIKKRPYLQGFQHIMQVISVAPKLMCVGCKHINEKSDYEIFECGKTCCLCITCRKLSGSSKCKICERPYSLYELDVLKTLKDSAVNNTF